MNRKIHAVCIAAAALALTLTAFTAPVLAQENGDGDSSGPGLGGLIDEINDLVEELEDFTGDWDTTLKELLTALLFQPFRTLAQQLLRAISILLTTTPSVHPNPAVEDVHRDTLIVTYLLSSLAFIAAGILHIIGPILGVSYADARRILPRLITALVFATVSLPLLQLAVELTNALSTAFAPACLTMSLTELAGLSTSLVLVWVAETAVLLPLAALFILRNIYILFGAAISPLLALGWSLPKAKRYADTFIAGWFAALLIAPLDLLALQFSLALLKGQGANLTQSVANWVLGIGSFTLLIIIPYQVWTASQTAVGQAYSASNGIKKRVKSSETELEQLLDKQERQRLRESLRKRKNSETSDRIKKLRRRFK